MVSMKRNLSTAVVSIALSLIFMLAAVDANAADSHLVDSLKRDLEAYSARDHRKVKMYYRLGWQLKNQGLFREALAWADSAMMLSKALEFPQGVANVHSFKSVLYRYLDQYTQAYQHAMKGLAIAQEHGLKETEARCYNNLGPLYDDLGKYPQALECYQKSLLIAEKLDLKIGIALCLTNIGNVYEAMGRNEEARSYQLRSLEVRQQMENPVDIATVYHNLAMVEPDTPQAFAYFRRSAAVNLKNEEYFGIYISYNALGYRFLERGRLDSAEHYLLRALEMMNKMDHNHSIKVLGNLATVYRRRGQLERALDTARRAYQIVKDDENLEEREYATQQLYQSFEAARQADSALFYHKRLKSITDSLFNRKKSRQMGQLEAQMAFERERRELEAAQQVQAQTMKRQRLQIAGVVGVAGILLVSSLLLVRSQRKIKRSSDLVSVQKAELESHRDELQSTLEQLEATQNQLVESEKMVALGQMVAGLAHEVNTPVGVGITATTHVQHKTTNIVEQYNQGKLTKEKFQEYLQEVYDSASILLDNLERTAELVQSFKQVSVDQVTERARHFQLREYLDNILASIMPEARHLQLSVDIQCPETLEVNSYPGVYAQIITNLFTNSIRHGFARRSEGKIQIEAFEEAQKLYLIFRDNGSGIEPIDHRRVFEPFFTTDQQNGTGLGLYIVYNLVTQKLFGTIELAEPPKGHGLEVRMCFPLHIALEPPLPADGNWRNA